jgi:sterol desaturase/sphingolipid hydroxylase (fatty acid hydroxylase superfamily)
MDVTTANRFHLGEIIASSVLRIPVIALLGIRLPELALYETAMFAVVQFQHANISVGPRADALLRLFIVTPFIHKVHHSRWQPETDSNFASLFSIWDRVFRTQRLREDPGTIQFGLDEFDAPAHHTLGGMMKTPFANGSGVESNASQPPRRQE